MGFGAVWGVPEETSEVSDDVDDQNGDDDQAHAMVAYMIRMILIIFFSVLIQKF